MCDRACLFIKIAMQQRSISTTDRAVTYGFRRLHLDCTYHTIYTYLILFIAVVLVIMSRCLKALNNIWRLCCVVCHDIAWGSAKCGNNELALWYGSMLFLGEWSERWQSAFGLKWCFWVNVWPNRAMGNGKTQRMMGHCLLLNVLFHYFPYIVICY